MDFYAAVDLRNGGTGDRYRGIKLRFADPRPDGYKEPRLVTPGCEKSWSELPENERCPNQGFFNWA
jgi:hypothetical protein